MTGAQAGEKSRSSASSPDAEGRGEEESGKTRVISPPQTSVVRKGGGRKHERAGKREAALAAQMRKGACQANMPFMEGGA